ncbi:hypothetical protein [Microvirga lenta]|uniref:hypothetical protein n=1 Tax=Microvirga lenta TaxID=2881337 RepID=UPI001D001181|nr:hypothetical protein [Microvirga lenta]MCB5177466.1 hypothetical protein [Microvirga lenta]
MSADKAMGPDRFPEAALTTLLLGPTMSFVLTYAIMSIPLHKITAITPMMGLAGALAIMTSVAFGWLLFPLFAKVVGRYYGAVIATAFIAVTTGWDRWRWRSCVARRISRARSSPCRPSCR